MAYKDPCSQLHIIGTLDLSNFLPGRWTRICIAKPNNIQQSWIVCSLNFNYLWTIIIKKIKNQNLKFIYKQIFLPSSEMEMFSGFCWVRGTSTFDDEFE